MLSNPEETSGARLPVRIRSEDMAEAPKIRALIYLDDVLQTEGSVEIRSCKPRSMNTETIPSRSKPGTTAF